MIIGVEFFSCQVMQRSFSLRGILEWNTDSKHGMEFPVLHRVYTPRESNSCDIRALESSMHMQILCTEQFGYTCMQLLSLGPKEKKSLHKPVQETQGIYKQ